MDTEYYLPKTRVGPETVRRLTRLSALSEKSTVQILQEALVKYERAKRAYRKTIRESILKLWYASIPVKKEIAPPDERPSFKYTIACAEAEGELAELLGSVYAAQAICEAISLLVSGGTQPLGEETLGVGRRVWQASIWSGPGPDELVETVVYGHSLSAVREAALNWLNEHGPLCLRNGFSRQAVPLALWAEYSQRKTVAYEQGETEAREPSSLRGMKRKRPTRSRRVPKSGQELEMKQEMLSEQSVPDEPAKPPTLDDAVARISKPPPVPARWERTGLCHDEWSMTRFERAEEAYNAFVSHDLLIEKGPDYQEEAETDAVLRQVKAIKVVDDEEVANYLLQRAGWSLLKVLGKLAPVRGNKTVLFVLAHRE